MVIISLCRLGKILSLSSNQSSMASEWGPILIRAEPVGGKEWEEWEPIPIRVELRGKEPEESIGKFAIVKISLDRSRNASAGQG